MLKAVSSIVRLNTLSIILPISAHSVQLQPSLRPGFPTEKSNGKVPRHQDFTLILAAVAQAVGVGGSDYRVRCRGGVALGGEVNRERRPLQAEEEQVTPAVQCRLEGSSELLGSS